jgi:hypothetical protein
MNQNNNPGQQGDNKPGQPNQQPNQQPSHKPGQGSVRWNHIRYCLYHPVYRPHFL